MEYHRQTESGVRVYQFRDRWTFRDHSKVADIASDLETSDTTECIIDLSEVDFIDSAGLGMLLLMREKVNLRGGKITIRGAAPKIRNVMKMARFDSVFALAE